MPRITYEPSKIAAIIRNAAEAHKTGKTWLEAFVDANMAGYQGSVSSLQKLVRAHTQGAKPAQKKESHAGYKNSTKSMESAATGANAFQKRARPQPASAPAAGNFETLQSIQNRLPVLRDGTHYPRPISLFQSHFQNSAEGEIVAWSRILQREEAVCIVNSNTQYPRGADVLVDCELNPPGSFLTVILTSAFAADPGTMETYPLGTRIPIQRRDDGTAFVEIRNVAPAASVVLSNTPHLILEAAGAK